jgi:hypothetical protein
MKEYDLFLMLKTRCGRCKLTAIKGYEMQGKVEADLQCIISVVSAVLTIWDEEIADDMRVKKCPNFYETWFITVLTRARPCILHTDTEDRLHTFKPWF